MAKAKMKTVEVLQPISTTLMGYSPGDMTQFSEGEAKRLSAAGAVRIIEGSAAKAAKAAKAQGLVVLTPEEADEIAEATRPRTEEEVRAMAKEMGFDLVPEKAGE